MLTSALHATSTWLIGSLQIVDQMLARGGLDNARFCVEENQRRRDVRAALSEAVTTDPELQSIAPEDSSGGALPFIAS